MAKNTGVLWFKMLLSFAPLILAVPSVNVGEGVKWAMRYFKDGELPPDDFPEMSKAVFDMLRDSINQAFADCERKSENAQRANAIRWGSIQVGSMLDPEKEPEEEEKRGEERRERTTTTTDSTYTGTPVSGGAGGGDFPPDILAYAREAARGANNPAAYEAAILERIRKAGFKTIEEVKAADEDRRKRPQTGPVYAEEDDFY